MTTKITVKRKIIYDGKEYASVEDLPEEVRRAYERAVGNSADTSHDQGETITKARIVLNGQEYEGVDEMPAGVRRTYDAVLAGVEGNAGGEPGVAQGRGSNPSPPLPIAPEASNSKLMIALAGIAVLLLILYFLGSTVTSR